MRRGRTHAEGRALRELARANFPGLLTLSEGALSVRFRRAAGGRLRERPVDLALKERDERIHGLLGAAYSEFRREEHCKGPWLERSVGSRRKILERLLASPRMQAALLDEAGGIPSLSQVERIVRARQGAVDARVEWKPHLDMTIGFRAEYAGQCFVLDATGFPVRVKNSKGGNQKYERRWGHFCFDVASGKGWAYSRPGDSEHAGWDAALKEFFFSQDFAPEWLNVDQASGLFDGLRHIGEEKEVKLSEGVLLWLAAGCKPYCHASARPTGGAYVEQNIRAAKDAFNALLVGKAVEKQLAGLGLHPARKFESELAFEAVYREFQAGLNKRTYRGAASREELWRLPSAVTARAKRALAENLSAPAPCSTRHAPLFNWQYSIARARVSRLQGARLSARVNGKAQAADLTRESLDQLAAAGVRPTEMLALTMPGGMRAGDEPDLVRVVIVEAERYGQPKYHASEARCARVDEYFQDARKPGPGVYHGAFEGAQDVFRRTADAAAASWRKRVTGLKEATNDVPVSVDADSSIKPE